MPAPRTADRKIANAFFAYRRLGIPARGVLVCAMSVCLFGQVPIFTITQTNLGCKATTGIATSVTGDVFVSCDNLVRKLATNGTISTVAGGGPSSIFSGDGGPATSVSIAPGAIATDGSGNFYFADSYPGRIRKVAANGIITTIAGPGSSTGTLGDGGPATNASVDPSGLAIDALGNIYIADAAHSRVRKITPDGIINTVAGNGSSSVYQVDGVPATTSGLSPVGVAVDSTGTLYILDHSAARVRKVSSSGIITTMAGNGYSNYFGDGGLATLAALDSPNSVAVDSSGNLYISEDDEFNPTLNSYSSRVQIVGGNGVINSVVGTEPPLPAVVTTGVAIGSNGQIYLATNSGIGMMVGTGKTFFPLPTVIQYRTASDFSPISANLGQGAYAEILGSYLAPDSRSWAAADFNNINAPTSLDGTSVMIGGQPGFVSYISPGQINVQVPTNIGTGIQPMLVTTSAGTASTLWTSGYPIGPTINPSAAALLAPLSFKSLSAGIRTIVAIFPDGITYALPTGFIPGVPSRPARGGDTLTFYGLGFGPVVPNTPGGQIAQTGSALQLSLQFPQLTINYAGSAPGTVGLYQFNVTLPKTVPTPYMPISFILDGVINFYTVLLSTQ